MAGKRKMLYLDDQVMERIEHIGRYAAEQKPKQYLFGGKVNASAVIAFAIEQLYNRLPEEAKPKEIEF